MNIQTVIERLKEENYTILEKEQIKTSPWFVNALIGFSAWFAALFILMFFFGLLDSFFREPLTGITYGIVLCGGSILLHRAKKDNLFISQLTLAFCIAGEILLITGFAIKFENVIAVSAVSIIVQLLIIVFYDSSIHRFLSVPAVIAALIAIILDIKLSFILYFLVFGMAAAVIVMQNFKEDIIYSKFCDYFGAIFYGLVFSILFFFVFSVNREFTGVLKIKNWLPVALGVMIVFIYFQTLIFKELSAGVFSKISIISCIFTILLTLLTGQSPGIIAALLIMCIGFNYRDVFIFTAAALFLIFYIITYYYNMETTLLVKSQILFFSGLLFSAAALILKKTSALKPVSSNEN